MAWTEGVLREKQVPRVARDDNRLIIAEFGDRVIAELEKRLSAPPCLRGEKTFLLGKSQPQVLQ
jgi:hypothetical protein